MKQFDNEDQVHPFGQLILDKVKEDIKLREEQQHEEVQEEENPDVLESDDGFI